MFFKTYRGLNRTVVYFYERDTGINYIMNVSKVCEASTIAF